MPQKEQPMETNTLPLRTEVAISAAGAAALIDKQAGPFLRGKQMINAKPNSKGVLVTGTRPIPGWRLVRKNDLKEMRERHRELVRRGLYTGTLEQYRRDTNVPTSFIYSDGPA
jgi:hypothetical protein